MHTVCIHGFDILFNILSAILVGPKEVLIIVVVTAVVVYLVMRKKRKS